jgi:flagellar protein FlgJ
MRLLALLVGLVGLILAAVLIPQPGSALAYTANVKAGSQLNVRSGPGTDNPVVAAVGDEQVITVACQVWGEQISGTQRTTPYWNRIGDGQYISDAYLVWNPARPDIAWCGAHSGQPATATVTASTLNVRSGPGTGNSVIAQLATGTGLSVRCQAWGTRVENTGAWLQIGDGAYVTAAYVGWSPDRPWLPWCGQAPPDIPQGGTSGFIEASSGPAREAMRAYRVPASVSIAQAILESGWGRSTLTRDDHNYFGKKCFGGPGEVAMGCRDYATSECSGRDCWATRADFRAYRNSTDSYVDHGRQLTELDRYAEALKYTADPDQFAREIHKAGYATDAGYADKLINLMRQYDLYRYDRLP